MQFITRPAKNSELNIALRLLKSAATDLQKKGIDQWSIWLDPPAEKIAWVEQGFNNHEFYFVVVNDSIAGMYRLLLKDELYWGEQEHAAWYVHSLVILNEYSGLRIGSQVLTKLINEAKSASIPYFRLDCNAANKKLCLYYEQHGFLKKGEKQMPHSLNNLYELKLHE
jgi:ribosomal protein S18 acetylase RimI-like enzyme